MLRISRQLYGRDRETAILLEKASPLSAGLRGYFWSKARPELASWRCWGSSRILSATATAASSPEFYQERNVPYLALTQAFQQLIGQLLGGTKEELERWRSRS